MGILTEFEGKFNFDECLESNHLAYLKAFNQTRRMKWSESSLQYRPDPIREAVSLPIGPQGAYYVGDEMRPIWEGGDPAIEDYNSPPSGQPSLWCLWTPSDEGKAIAWNGGDKFYAHVEWIRYLIDHFIQPWGYHLRGKVEWESEVHYRWSDEFETEKPCLSCGDIIIESNEFTINKQIVWLTDMDDTYTR